MSNPFKWWFESMIGIMSIGIMRYIFIGLGILLIIVFCLVLRG